jgi:thiamine biosynthesis lipoprotein
MNLARRVEPWLGTFVHVEACAADAPGAAAALATAFAAIAAVHRAMSFHAADSDLTRLNTTAHLAPVRVSAHTLRVIRHALAVAAASDGLFDPTIAAQLVACGLLPAPGGSVPDSRATWRDIVVADEESIAFRRPLWLDLGGIAKGYAVDQAIDALVGAGATRGCVNAGGDLRVFGMDAAPLALALRDPRAPQHKLALGHLAHGAVASSGDYFCRPAAHELSPGQAPSDIFTYSPIVSRALGLRPAGRSSVTVVAAECWIADALTKLVSLLGSAAGPLLASFDAHAAILDGDGCLRAMPGFRERLNPMPAHEIHA